MTDEIDIPASAYEPKAYFQNRPSKETVREIQGFIQRTGLPYMWPGHTHTKPQPNSTILYIGEFDLPASHRAEDRWAPCPCCSPTHPKYWKSGKIAWFPDEHVIRLIGPQCFASINKVAHKDALREFRLEEQRKKDIAYLMANIGLVPEGISIINHTLPISRAVDTVHKILRDRIDHVLHTSPRIWEHVRDGMLKVTEKRNETVRLADGEEFTREIELTVPYGPLPGYNMLNPSGKAITPKLEYALAALTSLQDMVEAKIEELSDDQRTKMAKIFGRSLKKAREAVSEIEDIRPFLSPVAIATLNGWGRHSGCPISIHVAINGNDLCIGIAEHEWQRLRVPPEFFGVLRALPRIADSSVAA